MPIPQGDPDALRDRRRRPDRVREALGQLGDAVTEQVADIVDNPQTDEVNPAAIELARGRLRGLNQGIDLAIDEYLARFRELA